MSEIIEQENQSLETTSQEPNIENNDSPEKIESLEKKDNFKTNSLIYCFLLVFGVTFVVFTFVFQVVLTPIKVIGVSMQPTINSSVTSDSDEEHCDIVYYNKQKHFNINDIVIVLNTDNAYISKDENVYSLIKRVVACPKQSITFYLTDDTDVGQNLSDPSSGRYYYDFIIKDENGKIVEVDQSYLDEKMYFSRELYENLMYSKVSPVYDEYDRLKKDYPEFITLIETLIGDDGDFDFNGNTDNAGNSINYTIEIEDNHYFVMGDNRNESADSRYFGLVKNSDIAGKVVLQVKFGQNLWSAIFTELKSLFLQRNFYEKIYS